MSSSHSKSAYIFLGLGILFLFGSIPMFLLKASMVVSHQAYKYTRSADEVITPEFGPFYGVLLMGIGVFFLWIFRCSIAPDRSEDKKDPAEKPRRGASYPMPTALYPYRHSASIEMTHAEARDQIARTCGNGWLPLVDEIYERLHASARVSDIYQKWGALRFDAQPWSEFVKVLEENIEEKSMRTCEICGAPGMPRELDEWIHTRCDLHANRKHYSEPP